MTFRTRVYDVVRSVPPGRVTSYGAIADAAGHPGAARRVGRALRELDRMPEDHGVPWWRVITARGIIAIPAHDHGAALQRALLREDGIDVDDDGRVDMKRYAWDPDASGPLHPAHRDPPARARRP